MTQSTTNSQLEINAKQLNLTDLDFPECVERLKNYIEANVCKDTRLIKLDVRWCVVIYSQSQIFLDTCLQALQSDAKDKKLIILTTDNYITKELTCFELFRTTLAVHENDNDPKSTSAALNLYCKNNDLSIEIKVFSGDSEDANTPQLHSYLFPEGDE